jgi:hypothetical protein
MPKRIQRSRAKGWRMPDGAEYVGRPTRWGNPFRIEGGWLTGPGVLLNTTDRPTLQMAAVEAFRRALTLDRLPIGFAYIRRELRGKDLACWCRLDQPCHADVLLEIANDGEAP